MSKDKAGKKDKWKHLDLFDMMLNQSQVFRDMVEHFQSAWAPHAPSMVVEASMSTRRPAGEHAGAEKTAAAAKPARKAAASKVVARPAAAKPAKPAAVAAPRKKAAAGKTASAQAKPAAPRKAAGKRVAASRASKQK